MVLLAGSETPIQSATFVAGAKLGIQLLAPRRRCDEFQIISLLDCIEDVHRDICHGDLPFTGELP